MNAISVRDFLRSVSNMRLFSGVFRPLVFRDVTLKGVHRHVFEGGKGMGNKGLTQVVRRGEREGSRKRRKRKITVKISKV